MLKKYVYTLVAAIALCQDAFASCYEVDHLNPEDKALSVAVRDGDREYLDKLLQVHIASDNPLSIEKIVNQIFCYAAEHSHQPTIEWMFSQPYSIPFPSEFEVHHALFRAKVDGHLSLVQFMLEQTFVPITDECDICSNIRDIANHGHFSVLEFIANKVNLSVKSIIEGIKGAIYGGHLSVLEWMMNQLPAANQNINHEIHTYVDTSVNVQAKQIDEQADAVLTPAKIRLNTAVLEAIENRLKAKDINVVESQQDVRDRLITWVNKKFEKKEYDKAKKKLALNAITYGFKRDTTPERLAQIIAFLDTFHPESFDAWMSGFVMESITDYQGRENTLSCIPGIAERMITGLRSIDPELDALFVQVEKPEMIKRFFASLNIGTTQGVNFVVNQLTSTDITQEYSGEDAAGAFGIFIAKHIESHGVVADWYSAEINNILESLTDHYDGKIRGRLQGIKADAKG